MSIRQQEIIEQHRLKHDEPSVSQKSVPSKSESYDKDQAVHSANEAYKATENQKTTSGLADTFKGILEGQLGPDEHAMFKSATENLAEGLRDVKFGLDLNAAAKGTAGLPGQCSEKNKAAASR